jgi:hypothetical protein
MLMDSRHLIDNLVEWKDMLFEVSKVLNLAHVRSSSQTNVVIRPRHLQRISLIPQAEKTVRLPLL